ncbi:MAG TPA: sugar ABC transporter ATP-binding protein [Alphaproteobacteria bacterium]|nr:sugar ABC transporter ATP-binding protein [Alphaproteobacteria bacterium]
MPLLAARHITKRFGGVVALSDGALTVERGEVHVLIGANGCGKSTLCKIVTGAVAPDGGEILFDGRAVSFASPKAARAAGISVFYQELSLVPQLTVAQNIMLGVEPSRGGFVDEAALRARAEALIALMAEAAGPGFGPDAYVGDLGIDQKSIVEILKALAAKPRLVIFDEATSSLDRRQVAAFFDLVRRLKAEGTAIIFISHRMEEIFAIGDRITVMRNGATVAALDLAATDRDAIVAHMVGDRPPAPPAALAKREPGAPVLTVEGLCGPKLRDVSLELRRGEIVGLGGLHGQGQSELLLSLFGAAPVAGGTMRLDGQALRPDRPLAAMRHGIAYVSGDRGRSGVFAQRPIFENFAQAALSKGRGLAVRRGGLMARIAPIAERLKLRFPGYAAPVRELSGGNQQKVVIGRWLATAPAVLLLDDPTKGIDVGAKADLYAILAELCREGVAVLLYSSEDSELLTNADRILVFNGGRVVETLSGAALNEHALYRAALGGRAEAA